MANAEKVGRVDVMTDEPEIEVAPPAMEPAVEPMVVPGGSPIVPSGTDERAVFNAAGVERVRSCCVGGDVCPNVTVLAPEALDDRSRDAALAASRTRAWEGE